MGMRMTARTGGPSDTSGNQTWARHAEALHAKALLHIDLSKELFIKCIRITPGTCLWNVYSRICRDLNQPKMLLFTDRSLWLESSVRISAMTSDSSTGNSEIKKMYCKFYCIGKWFQHIRMLGGDVAQ